MGRMPPDMPCDAKGPRGGAMGMPGTHPADGWTPKGRPSCAALRPGMAASMRGQSPRVAHSAPGAVDAKRGAAGQVELGRRGSVYA